MKIVVAVLLSFVCAVAVADPDSRWFKAGETTDMKTYIQRGSLEQTVTPDGRPAATVIGMAISTSNTAVVEKWHVTRDACLSEAGQLRATTLEGLPKRTIDFVFGAGTIGAHQAELICDGYKQWLARNPDKN
jgi:hypothetical protein